MNKKFNMLLAVIGTCAALLAAAPASAGLIALQTSMNPNPSLTGSQYVFIGNRAGTADDFQYTRTEPTDLYSISFWASYWGGLAITPGAELIVGFHEGVDLNTATLLETWNVTPTSTTLELFNLQSVGGVALTTNSNYWVSYTTASNAAFSFSWATGDDVSRHGSSSRPYGGGLWSNDPSLHSLGMNVVGISPDAVPPTGVSAPATLALFALGLLGMTQSRRRKTTVK